MTVPAFTLTGDLNALSGITETPLAGTRLTFTSNIQGGSLLTVDGALQLIGPTSVALDVNGQINGTTGIQLLANDDSLGLATPLQWTISVAGSTIDGWTFNAPAAGDVLDLKFVAPVVGQAAVGLSRGPQGLAGPPGLGIIPTSVQTGPYTVTARDGFLVGDATAGAFTYPLPDAAGLTGQQFTFKKRDLSGNPITVSAYLNQTIDGQPTQVLTYGGHLITIISDGSNWQLVYTNYNGAELGYAEVVTATTSTNTAAGSASMSVNAIPGLSLTVIGAGRPVMVEFVGQGYNTTVDTPIGVALLTNSSTANGAWAYGATHVIGVGFFAPLVVRRRLVLTAGQSYSFQVGMWVAGSTGHFYADTTTPQPMYLSVIGQ